MSVFKDYISTKILEDGIIQSKYTPSDIKNNDLVIAVMDRGWVFVGFVTVLPHERVRLDCAHVIHHWGTTQGLGELAIKGPLQDTILFPSEAVVGKPLFLIKTNEGNW